MKKEYCQNKSYTIETRLDSWFTVKKDDKVLAITMDATMARQVIYKDIMQNFGECEFLKEEDFQECGI